MAEYLSKSGLTKLVDKIKELLDDKATKLLNNTESGQVLLDDGDGNLSSSGITIGNGTLDENPSSTVLATELAVSTIASQKANKLIDNTELGQVLLDDGDGNLSSSGITIGSYTLDENPSSTVLATEAAVAAAITESTDLSPISDAEIDELF